MKRFEVYCMVIFVFMIIFSVGCQPKIEDIINNLQVSLKVNSKSGTSDSATGYPIMIDINVSGSTKSKALYVHLFQKEVKGSEYYYQSSTQIMDNSPYAVIFKGCNFCNSEKADCNALI